MIISRLTKTICTLFKAKQLFTQSETPLPKQDPKLCGLKDAVMSGWFKRETGELIEGFPILSGELVLDIGCGEGAATLFSAEQNAAVTFVDNDPQKIDQLEKKLTALGYKDHRSILSESTSLPIDDNSVDKVIAMEVLEHVPSPEKFLKELHRCAKPGALFLISVPDPIGEKAQKTYIPTEHFEAPNHIHIFGRDEFEKLIIHSGLTPIKRTQYGFFWLVWNCLYWAEAIDKGHKVKGASLDSIQPPYPPITQHWTDAWAALLSTSSGQAAKDALDAALPKSQVIIARKD